jgi:hypothetical protein
MRTVRDWYLNAEDGGGESPGVDPANDDQPDRNPDRWLDRAVEPARGRRNNAGAGQASRPLGNGRRMPGRPGSVIGASPSGRPGRSGPDLSGEFRAAVRQKIADNPTLSVSRLAAELRECGWRNVEPWHVHQALYGRQPVVPAQRERPTATTHRADPPARGARRMSPPNAAPRAATGRRHPAQADPVASAPADPAAVFCRACDVRVSVIGTCRCS